MFPVFHRNIDGKEILHHNRRKFLAKLKKNVHFRLEKNVSVSQEMSMSSECYIVLFN